MDLYKAVLAISLMLGLLSCQPRQTAGAKILFYPFDIGFNSRAINLAKLATYLQDDGHNVTIILNTAILAKYKPSHLRIVKYDLPEDVGLPPDLESIAKFEDVMHGHLGIMETIRFWAEYTTPFCEALISHKDLLKDLKAENYDLLFIDIGTECSRIISDYLDITTILYANHGFTVHNFMYPRITSFVCDPFTPFCSSDEMAFTERLMNSVIMLLYEKILYPNLLSYFQEIRKNHGMNTSLSILNPVSYSKSIVIVNVDFVLDYPRPLMPHVFPISGLYQKKPKPLPTDLTSFIEQSPYDSIVVVSFGTMVDKLSPDRAEIMARVFSKLPAVVIWRLTGTPPKALAENTKLVGWYPQYDVLAHPKTRLFVTHCGVSATFEAASLGIPVVALPMMADQRYHASQLVNRLKMGVLADWAQFSEANFERNLLNAFHNQELEQNARKAADLMNDRDIDPKKKFLHLVNFTIRHNGAEHLISRPGRELNTLQFYSVDVVCFLLCITALIILVFFLLLRSILRFCRKDTAMKLKKN